MLVVAIGISLSMFQNVLASEIEDPPPPTDLCGLSSTVYSTIYADGYLYCRLEFSGDNDWIKYTPTTNSAISVYSTGTTNVKVYVYESTDLVNNIAYNNDAIGTGTFYTIGSNFYTEFYAEQGKSYFIKVIGYYTSTTGTYYVHLDDCHCVNDPSEYYLGYDSVDGNNNIQYNINSTLYETEIIYSIGQWNNLGLIDIEEDTNYTILDINIFDYFEDDITSAFYAIGYYQNKSGADDLGLNRFFFQNSTGAMATFEGKTKVIMHELGHALGSTMDINNASQYFIDLVEEENVYNVQRQGFYTVDGNIIYLYSPGPCDRDSYYERWGD